MDVVMLSINVISYSEYRLPTSTRDPLIRERAGSQPNEDALQVDEIVRTGSPVVFSSQVGDSVSVNSDSSVANWKTNHDVDQEELRCVIAVIRHGDRTVSLTMSLTVSHHVEHITRCSRNKK